MAPLTDLTWQQLANQLPADSISLDAEGKPMLDISVVLKKEVTELTEDGVVLFFNLMFMAANKAQILANQNQADGERLTAFNPATVGATVDGYVSLTRPFTCRSELSSATNIIGTNG